MNKKGGYKTMEIESLTEDIVLNDVELRHGVTIIGLRGRPTHVLVFQDKQANTYCWVTGSFPSGFEEGKIYDIKGKLDRTRNNRLSYVKIIKDNNNLDSNKSEQPDAEDVLLGLSDYNYLPML